MTVVEFKKKWLRYKGKETSAYHTSPLEEMAYRLQACFDRHEPPFEVATLVRLELDRIVPALLARANGL